MISLLNEFEQLLESKINDENKKRFLLDEIKRYKHFYLKYKSDNTSIIDDFVFNDANQVNKHRIILLPSEKTITMSWDIRKILSYAQQNHTIDYYSIDELNAILYEDISSSIDEFQRIKKETVYQHKHQR